MQQNHSSLPHTITFSALLPHQFTLHRTPCPPHLNQQSYPLDNKTLLAIEVPVMALLEAKRYEGYKKTGEVRGVRSEAGDVCALCNGAHRAQGTE